jgi:hypothetical protein
MIQRVKSYRIVNHKLTLTLWRTISAGISDIIHVEEDCCARQDRACEDAVSRCVLAAEEDHGALLPWIVGTDDSSLVMWTGPVEERVREQIR